MQLTADTVYHELGFLGMQGPLRCSGKEVGLSGVLEGTWKDYELVLITAIIAERNVRGSVRIVSRKGTEW
jgi:hypothetical protein